MGATHDNIIQITILLDPPPAGVAGFRPLILGDEQDGTTLDGDRFRVYSADAIDEIDADEDANFLSEFIANAVRRGFAQNPSPSEIVVGRVDTDAGAEGYDDALSEIEGDAGFYAVAIDSRDASDHVDVAEWVEPRDKIFIFQSADADWLDADPPAGYSEILGTEQTAGLFHDQSGRSEEFSWLCNRLGFDPDEISVPWDAPIGSSVAYTDDLTTGQASAAEDNNINLLLSLGDLDHYVANNGVGVNLQGRQISEIFTKHWFKIRLAEAVAAEKVRRSARGEKIPVSLEGSSLIEGIVSDLFDQGEDADHFLDTETDFPTPTQADIEQARIRGGGNAQLSISAGEFVFNFVFQRGPLDDE